jgi:hypothetical protein
MLEPRSETVCPIQTTLKVRRLRRLAQANREGVDSIPTAVFIVYFILSCWRERWPARLSGV